MLRLAIHIKTTNSNLRWLLLVVFFCVCSLGGSAETAQSFIDTGLRAYQAESYQEAMRCFLEAEKRARDNKDSNVLFAALLNIGNCYLFVDENGEALSHYAEAYELARKQKLGWKQENYVQNSISAVYFEDGDYGKARELVEKCLANATENQDTASIITYSLNLVLIANKEAEQAMSSRYLQQVQQLVALPKWKSYATSWEITACDADFAFGRDVDFERKARKLLNCNGVTKADREEILLHLLQTLQRHGEAEQVIRLAQQSWFAASANGRMQMSQLLATIYRQRRDWQQALRYKDSLLAYSDTVAALANRQMMEKSKVRMQLFQARSEMETEIHELKQKRIAYVILLFMSVTIIVIIVRLLFMTRERAKREKQLMDLQLEKEKQSKLLAEEQMRETELIAHYKQQLMRQTLEEKKRELSATILFTEARNKLIEDIIEKLNAQEKQHDGIQLAEIIAHLKQQLKDNERDQLLVKFDAANSDFVARLQKAHPHLSPSDIRFLSLIRMNLSNKEISSLLNITPESCKMRKIRLCRKLGFDSTQQLCQYVMREF